MTSVYVIDDDNNRQEHPTKAAVDGVIDMVKIVRAVLGALREPPDAVLDAMGKAVPAYTEAVMRDMWRAGIDAIISETTP